MIELKKYIEQIGFPNTNIKRTSITISVNKIKLLNKQKNRLTLLLKRTDREDTTKVIDCYPLLKKISFPTDFDVTKILYNGLYLSYQNQIDKFLQLKKNKKHKRRIVFLKILMINFCVILRFCRLLLFIC